MKHELENAKRSNDWYANELQTKNAEALKFRKEKSARIAELQRQNEDANSNIEALTRSEQVLRKRLEEAQAKTEEALTKVQQLQEAAARTVEDHKQELESSRRLVELTEQQSQTHRNRLKEVELRLAQVKDDDAEEIRRIRRELEQAKEDLVQAEQRAAELQSEVDRLKAIVESHHDAPVFGSGPQTPRANGSFLARASSPFGTPASIRGMRATDALEEVYSLRGQLSTEKQRCKKLQEDLDEAVSMLEAKLPEIDELNAESERLRNEVVEMSRIMEQSYEERDLAVKATRKAESNAVTAETEAKILRAQLRDLTTQVTVLLYNIEAERKGIANLTEEETQKFERMLQGEISEGSLDDLSDTHQFISQKFVVYRDIHELQAKNQELVRVTRELADKMENEEALAAKEQAAQDHAEVQELRNTVAILQDEVRSITVRMKSHIQERDMFRRMLQQKATPAEIRATLGSADPNQREVLASIEQNSPANEDLAEAMRELQNQFDSYRNDQNIERNSLKDQIQRLSAEKGALQSEVSRISSQLTLATERYNILESNFKAGQSELQELQKRNQALSESAAKQDMRTQQAAEDLVEARGLAESLRSENANLKAEKSLWKSIQERLSQDNENLSQEKTRLNGLLSSQQSLLNERELSESETRRRLQNQVDALEAELTSTKRKLTEEVEENKKIQLRKEFDSQQFQKRIDELTSTISQVKEENMAMKTSRDHLQARVGELEVELRNAQERADRLRPIPTPRPQATEDGSVNAELQARVEELENEVKDLKNSLELAKVQLENAQNESNAFKEMGRALEEDLTSILETQDICSKENEAKEAEKNAKINELEQRVEGLTAELSNSNNELNMLRDSQADLARRFEDKERMLNTEIARLKDEEERYKEAAKFHQQDLRAQADVTYQAQQQYEQELVRHAEAAKMLQQIRTEHNDLKTQAAAWKAEAESAKLSLAQSEQSWEERRLQLEQEIAEIKARRDDANAQNKLLHQQLESVSKQIASLQQSRAATDSAAEGSAVPLGDTATEGLRELNNYLRREKEILEVQYDLKVQEAKRLQQQFDYSQSQLDEARLKLEQERRSQADSTRNSLTHKNLMDKLNELNLIRESNVTLRNENQRAQAQIEQKNAKIAELEAKTQPLEAKISELEVDKQFKEAEIKQLQEARESLQKRIESILSKYGQADPHEVEQLKAKLEEFETQVNSLKEAEQTLQEKLKEAEGNVEKEKANWQALRAKLAEDFKGRHKAMKAARDEAIAERNSLQATLDAANERMTALEKELETAKEAMTNLEQEKNRLVEQQAATAATASQPQAAPASAEQNAELLQQLATLKQELSAISSQKATAEAELERLKSELSTAIAERDQARAQATNGAEVTMQDSDVVPAAAAPAAQPSGLSEEERKALEEKIAAAEAKAAEFEQKAKELEEQAENIVKQRSEKMKAALNKRLADSKEALEKQAQEEKERLEAEYKLRLEQELAIVKAEQATAAPPQNGVPSTPAKPQVQIPSTSTPAQQQLPSTPSVPSTPNVGQMDDTQIREFLKSNPTVLGIIRSNVRTQVNIETKKIRDEVEAEFTTKIANAREQTAQLAEKKTALKINMADQQKKNALAKIAIVEKAANETPQKPVVEVWNIAKHAKAPPASGPAAQAAPAQTAPSTPAAQGARAPGAPAPAAPASAPANGMSSLPEMLMWTDANHDSPAAPKTEGTQPAPATISKIPGTAPTAATTNPFGQPASAAPVNNPFGVPAQQGGPPSQMRPPSQASGGPPQQQQQMHMQHPLPQQPPPQAQNQQGGPVRTSIPVPRGGSNIARGGPRGGFNGPGGRGGQGQRGRGGFGRGGHGGGGMNPQAGDFQPGNLGAGNKRPRGDSEAQGGGVKRARGGGNVGGGGGGGGATQ